MKSNLIQINVSNLKHETKENTIKIKFKNQESVQVNFTKLFIESEYIRNKYKYSEALNFIQTEIKKIEEKLNISEEAIKNFIELIQEEKVMIPIEHYNDLYTLSEYFCIPKFTAELDNISQNELFTDLNFTIQILIDYQASKKVLETKLTSKIENFLRERINECIETSKFGELQISTISRIIEKCQKSVNQNLLVDFIIDSVDKRFILFQFVEIEKLRDEKVDELIEFINEQEEDSKKKYLEYMSFNLSFIISMRNKYNDFVIEMNQTKEELQQEKINHEKTKQEIKRIKKELEQEKVNHEKTKEELEQEKINHEKTKEELKQIELNHTKAKEELKHDKSKEEFNQNENIQFMQTIIVGGADENNLLGEKPNNINCGPIISPPLNLSIDPSSLLSYSVYNEHSIILMNDGSLKGIGNNEDGRITSSLHKASIDHFTDFSIKDSNGRHLDPVSFVCLGLSTLYMLTKSNGKGRQLVFYDSDIKGGGPVFLDIGNHHPVALFGGWSHPASIGSEGEVIFINRNSVIRSPKSRIESVSLPDGEKASSVACCEDSVVVLSLNGRVFTSPILKGSCVLKFSEVKELKGKEIVCLSGTSEHVLAVSKEGRVFGRGSNEYGKLGIGKGIETLESFVGISSLDGYEIRNAYAGCNHSLFQTREGKILSCGYNYYGELLLSSGPSEPVYSPTETTIKSDATFCIAGNCLSIVFIGCKPPPNISNTRILQYK